MIKVTESKPGHIDIGCEISRRPLTRANEYGMFCDATVCKCEQESKININNIMDFIKDIDKKFFDKHS
jgi:hypothetical protein